MRIGLLHSYDGHVLEVELDLYGDPILKVDGEPVELRSSGAISVGRMLLEAGRRSRSRLDDRPRVQR